MHSNAPETEKGLLASTLPKSEGEVFDYFLAQSDSSSPTEIDSLAYVAFSYRKKHWRVHFKQRTGRNPSQQEMDDWVSSLSPFEFGEMRKTALQNFRTAADAYMREILESHKTAAVKASILNEIKSFTSPWRHLPIALIMAIVAPILFGMLIFLASVFDSKFPIHIVFGSGH